MKEAKLILKRILYIPVKVKKMEDQNSLLKNLEEERMEQKLIQRKNDINAKLMNKRLNQTQ